MRRSRWYFAVLIMGVFCAGAVAWELAALHQFAGGANDGALPQGNLTPAGSVFYGMTYMGGDSDRGTVFTVGADGSGFSLLHEFAGGGSDGRNPQGSLAFSDSALYGMTLYGGDADRGVIFRIGTDGSD